MSVTKRNLLGFGRELAKQAIVHTELFGHLLPSGIRIRNLKGHFRSLLGIGKIIDECGALPDDGLIFSVQGIAIDQAGE